MEQVEDVPIAQAAEMLGIKPGSLRMQWRLGKISVHRAHPAGHELYVDLTEIERYRTEVQHKDPVPA